MHMHIYICLCDKVYEHDIWVQLFGVRSWELVNVGMYEIVDYMVSEGRNNEILQKRRYCGRSL